MAPGRASFRPGLVPGPRHRCGRVAPLAPDGCRAHGRVRCRARDGLSSKAAVAPVGPNGLPGFSPAPRIIRRASGHRLGFADPRVQACAAAPLRPASTRPTPPVLPRLVSARGAQRRAKRKRFFRHEAERIEFLALPCRSRDVEQWADECAWVRPQSNDRAASNAQCQAAQCPRFRRRPCGVPCASAARRYAAARPADEARERTRQRGPATFARSSRIRSRGFWARG